MKRIDVSFDDLVTNDIRVRQWYSDLIDANFRKYADLSRNSYEPWYEFVASEIGGELKIITNTGKVIMTIEKPSLTFFLLSLE